MLCRPMDFKEQFKDAPSDSHSVVFRYPVEAGAIDLDEWFRIKIKKRYRVGYWLDGDFSEMAVVRGWRFKEADWQELLNVLVPLTSGARYQGVVNFDDKKDAMVFKLTFG